MGVWASSLGRLVYFARATTPATKMAIKMNIRADQRNRAALLFAQVMSVVARQPSGCLTQTPIVPV